MVGTKRTSNSVDTRARKATKTSGTSGDVNKEGESDSMESSKRVRKGKGKGKGKGKSKAIPRSMFEAEALPIHVNLTHTPAAVIDNEEDPTTSSDPGYIGSMNLLPTEFSTGSYGWKGARRLVVELQGAEGKEKQMLSVMININATVVGSKEVEEEITGKEEQANVE